MDLFDIGIVVIAWFGIAGMVVAFAVAAGRADRAPRRPRTALRPAPMPTAERPRTFERRSGTDRRRVQPGMRTAIR